MPGIDSSAEFGHLLWPQVRQFQETRHIQAKENQMKIRLSTIVLLLGALSAASAQSNRAKHCSNATSAGRWGFTTNGVLILPTGAVPVTAVGHFVLDLHGNMEGSQVRASVAALPTKLLREPSRPTRIAPPSTRSVSTTILGISCVRPFSMRFSQTVAERPESSSNLLFCRAERVCPRYSASRGRSNREERRHGNQNGDSARNYLDAERAWRITAKVNLVACYQIGS